MQLLTKILLAFSGLLVVNAAPYDAEKRDGNYRSVAYYVDWAVYARNFHVQDLHDMVPYLTHILYSFANLDESTGEVLLGDKYADIQKTYPGDPTNDNGHNVYGCVKQLYLLKKENRNLKVLLSIGGWSWSSRFAGATGTEANRANFVRTAVGFVQDLGFDGIDIDWEYPSNYTEADNYVTLLKELRAGLDNYSAAHTPGYHYLLSASVPAGPSHYEILHISPMNQYLDMWNLMAYDYSGSWDNVTGMDANVYQKTAYPNSTPFNTDQAITYYTGNGASASKINLGLPLYGRAFQNTDGPGTTYSGVGPGSWQDGVWDYKALPRPGGTLYHEDSSVSAWTYDHAQRYMVSYDTPAIVQTKASYIKSKGLGGGAFWESSGDKTGSDSLIHTLVNALGGNGVLQRADNELNYPASQYDNIRKGMQ
ncbi:uncharacterized protein BHQ10_001149 [Talaromyces amestolkiae]|uniref:chitinase n=1 Tax=Talaromyces amestolkiae TaxID=1196081 RepID=A0A364KNK6_TALAM|nr:uncharacterized protein BHQ10_001149 [Talaromyces amestolkiae]RAO65137.1 hypothetical protein BHQ10_001149 [Talaromyces amestolkiae]